MHYFKLYRGISYEDWAAINRRRGVQARQNWTTDLELAMEQAMEITDLLTGEERNPYGVLSCLLHQNELRWVDNQYQNRHPIPLTGLRVELRILPDPGSTPLLF